jgi:hypothetical protein
MNRMSKFLSLMAALVLASSNPAAYAGGDHCAQKAEGECSKGAAAKTELVANVTGEAAKACSPEQAAACSAEKAATCSKDAAAKTIAVGNVTGECAKGAGAECAKGAKAEGECPMAKKAAEAKLVANVTDEAKMEGCCMAGAANSAAMACETPCEGTKVILTGDTHEGHGHGHEGMEHEGMGEMTPEMQAAMERWAKIATPGKQHADMASMAGTWTAETTMYMPGAEPMKSTGVATFEMALGGRYMIQRFKGEMPGMGPYEGMGISGYDIQKGEYFNMWLDSMGTAPLVSTGMEENTSMGDYYCPMADGMLTAKEVVKYDGGDTMHFEMWSAPAGTEDFTKQMEIAYTRKKPAMN